jgi:hypothetical protein
MIPTIGMYVPSVAKVVHITCCFGYNAYYKDDFYLPHGVVELVIILDLQLPV